MTDLDELIDALIEREGGYVNHPADRGGPTRWGFVFPHLFRGDVYGDTLDGLARSGMELTTTNFSSKLSLLDLPNIVDDPRVRAFYPPWEMASLKTTIACADKSGP